MSRCASFLLAILGLSACFTDSAPELTSGGGTGGSSGMVDPTSGGVVDGVCGDGIVQAGEQCDIGPNGNGACTDMCTLNVCGDGYVIPVVFRPRVSAAGTKVVAHLSGWDNDTWALAHWFKEA